ncbi:hypothetical protein B0H13DRAFT_1880638 [Mycena leptocephala]|nr:hypothetical protein B0H13DRAFT_1880638 [Mycena leptocephala]
MWVPVSQGSLASRLVWLQADALLAVLYPKLIKIELYLAAKQKYAEFYDFIVLRTASSFMINQSTPDDRLGLPLQDYLRIVINRVLKIPSSRRHNSSVIQYSFADFLAEVSPIRPEPSTEIIQVRFHST